MLPSVSRFVLCVSVVRYAGAQTLAEVSRGQLCATVDTRQSTGWKDSATEEDNFRLRLSAVHWVEGLEVRLEWAHNVDVDHYYEAELVAGGGESLKTALH
jgi:hypothetical protein